MNKLTKTAKRLDTFFHIMQIAVNIAWVASLVGIGILLIGLLLGLDPDMIGTGYESLDLGFVELEIAEDYIPNKHMILGQVGVVLALCMLFMLVSWKSIQHLRNVLAAMIRNEPFHSLVGTELKVLAKYSLVLGIIGNVLILAEQIFTTAIFDLPALLLGEKIAHITFNYQIDLTFLILAAVLLLISYVFRYGEQLQQLSDETL